MAITRLDEHDPDSGRGQLGAQGVDQPDQSELRGVVRPEHGAGDAPADRADEHDAGAGGPAQRRQHGLRHRELADQVDLDLAPEHVDGHVLQGSRQRDARVVDQSVQWSGRLYPGTGRRDGPGVGQVHPQHGDGVAVVVAQGLLILVGAHRGPHVRPLPHQLVDDSASDAGGCARHNVRP